MVWLTATALALSSVCVAQSRSGRFVGVVVGAEKQLSGIRLSLRREDMHHATTPREMAGTVTDSSGSFGFIGIPWGSYSLDVAGAGWGKQHVEHIVVCSDSTVSVRIVLSPLTTPTHRPAPRFLDEDVWWGTQFTELSTYELPNSRNVWSLLQAQEGSTVTDRPGIGGLDIGGLETGVPALFGALGASWTENHYSLNGLDVTDPYIPGRPLIDPDFDALAEFQVVTAAKPAIFENSGESVSLGTLRPFESLHGSARLFYSGRGLESDNTNARLVRFQFPGPERMNHLVDANSQLGGRLPAHFASLPFFVSLSTQQLSKDLGGFAAPIDSHIYRGLVELTPFSRSSQSVDLLYFGQHIFNSREGATPSISPDSTTRGNQNFHQFQIHGYKVASPATLLSANFGGVNAIVSSAIQHGVQTVSAVDLPQMTFTGSAPLSLAGTRTRYQAQVLVQTVREGPGRRHSLNLGIDWNRSDISNQWDALGGTERVLVQGIGAELIRWNTPAQARQHAQNVAEFIQDSWRPARWISLPVGLRVDTSTGRAVGLSPGISWTAFQPRAGFVMPLRPRGLVLQAGWSRFGHVLQGRYLDFGNPAALGAQIFRWKDLNGDRMVQPQEIGRLLQVFGGPYSAIERGLARPFTDEISFGLEQHVGALFSASIRFFRRDDHRLMAINNVGVPFSDYSPLKVLDTGNDGVIGTADDQVLTLYNRNPVALGHDFLVLSNSGFHASYKGFEARLDKRLLRSWEFSASFTASRTQANTSPGNSVFDDDTGFIGSLGADPNTLIMSQGRTHFDRAFTGKITAHYAAPRGFHLGAVASYYDGLPFGPVLFVSSFNQGPFFVRATPVGHPGGFQTELNSTLDVRLSREFVLKWGVLSAYLDIFNTLNFNSNTLEADLTGPAFLTRVPLSVEAPRTARLGVELNF